MALGLRHDLIGHPSQLGVVECSIGELDLHLKSLGNPKPRNRRGKHDETVGLLHCRHGLDDLLLNVTDLTQPFSVLEGIEHGINDPRVE